MKKILICLIMALVLNVMAQDKKETVEEKKIYSQEELDQKVEEELERRITQVVPKNLISFSKELLSREDALKVKLAEVEAKEQQLRLNEKSFEKKLDKFNKEQQEFLGCLNDNKEEAKKRADYLVSVISNMKPATAAEVLSTQDAEISVKILGMLEAAKAAKIFNSMKKEVSARLQKQYMNMKK